MLRDFLFVMTSDTYHEKPVCHERTVSSSADISTASDTPPASFQQHIILEQVDFRESINATTIFPLTSYLPYERTL